MYQTELMPESDKISKAIQCKSQSQISASDTTLDINTSVQEEDFKKIISDEHDDSLPHPSEVLIDLKVVVYVKPFFVFPNSGSQFSMHSFKPGHVNLNPSFGISLHSRFEEQGGILF